RCRVVNHRPATSSIDPDDHPVCSGCIPSAARRGRAVSQPTIHDVAKAAGVSVTTVSHALNGKGRVDPETRARVAQVVHRLGYRPTRAAPGLEAGRAAPAR